MTEAERLVHQAWRGEGDPPPLVVTQEQFDLFKSVGLPEHMMRVAVRPMVEGK